MERVGLIGPCYPLLNGDSRWVLMCSIGASVCQSSVYERSNVPWELPHRHLPVQMRCTLLRQTVWTWCVLSTSGHTLYSVFSDTMTNNEFQTSSSRVTRNLNLNPLSCLGRPER